ncbi:hypothetical protein FRC11_004957, partial [Ceratobasidium sp. 423]
MSEFDGFVETDQTIDVNLPKIVIIKGKQEFPAKDVKIVLHKPVVPDGAANPDANQHFALIVFPFDFPYLYMKVSDLLKRLSSDKTERETIYQADANSKFLDCQVWDEDGKLFLQNTQPPGLIVDTKSLDPRLTAAKLADMKLARQTWLWYQVAMNAARSIFGSTTRLWPPKGFKSPSDLLENPLELVIVQLGKSLSQGAFEQAIANAETRATSEEFGGKWIRCKLAPPEFDRSKNVLLSKNLLSYYASYMSLEHFRRLVLLQTSANKSKLNGESPWRCEWPKPDELKTIEKDIDAAQKKLPAKDREPIPDNFTVDMPLTTRLIYGRSNLVARRNTTNIMGASAEKVAETLWPGKSVEGFEWLHRSAFSFSYDMGFGTEGASLVEELRDKKSNLIFGTKEANMDMQRAEGVINRLRNSSAGTRGTLTTQIINKFESKKLKALNPETGAEEDWDIEADIQNLPYTWFAPKLEYSGAIRLAKFQNLPVAASDNLPTVTPLTVEGILDLCMLEAQIDSLRGDYLNTQTSSSSRRLQPVFEHGTPPVPSDEMTVGLNTLTLNTRTSISSGHLLQVPDHGTPPAPFNVMSVASDTPEILPIPSGSRDIHSLGLPTFHRMAESAPFRVAFHQQPGSDPGDAGPLCIHPKNLAIWNAMRSKRDHVKINNLVLHNPCLEGPD